MPALLRFNAATSCFGVTRFWSTRSGSWMPCSPPSVLSHAHRELWRWAAIARTVFLGVPGITSFHSSGGRFSISSLVTRLLVRHAPRRLERRSGWGNMQEILLCVYLHRSAGEYFLASPITPDDQSVLWQPCSFIPGNLWQFRRFWQFAASRYFVDGFSLAAEL